MNRRILFACCAILTLALASACAPAASTPAATPTPQAVQPTPADQPTPEPVITPTEAPTSAPTAEPTAAPTLAPTASPSPILSSEGAGTGTGTATARALGYNGYIHVSVTVEDGKITNVQVDTHQESEGIGTRAVDALPARIVEKGDFDVDALSGATFSSDGILRAGQLAYDEIMGTNEP